MKKVFLLLVASMMMVMGAKAEEATTLVATLSHDGSLSAYYGQDALKSAYGVARDGDVITLSAGTFNSVNMNKNITLRGVGAWDDPSTENRRTIISGDCNVKLPDNDYEFIAEGIYFTGRVSVSSSIQKECTFSKSYFSGTTNTIGIEFTSTVYAKMQHCVIYDNNYNSKLLLYKGILNNCVFGEVYPQSGTAPIVMQNCVFWMNDNSNYDFKEDALTNCLILTRHSERILNSSNDVRNCVFFSCKSVSFDIFQNITNNSNMIVSDRDNFFKKSSLVKKTLDQYGDVSSYSVSLDGLSIDETGLCTGLYELSDEAKQIYKGNDGTVVGVWGGTMPFNYIPNNPRISKCDIVPKVDADGKLSVTIEVAQ